MKALFAAISSKFQATTGSPAVHHALHIAVSGRMHNTVIPQNGDLPAIVVTLVSGAHEWTFTEDLENCLIQFSIFSEGSAADVCDLYEKLRAVFDDCTLTPTGYTHLFMQRENAQLIRDEENKCWQYIVEYRVMVEED